LKNIFINKENMKLQNVTKKQWIITTLALASLLLAGSSVLTKGLSEGLKSFGYSLTLLALVYWGMSD